jgi:hypothetical protein
MTNNKVKDWKEFEALKDLPCLVELNFVGNPLEQKCQEDGDWVAQVQQRLPGLKKLDGAVCPPPLGARSLPLLCVCPDPTAINLTCPHVSTPSQLQGSHLWATIQKKTKKGEETKSHKIQFHAKLSSRTCMCASTHSSRVRGSIGQPSVIQISSLEWAHARTYLTRP